MITCPHCQASNPDSARFCMSCGGRLPAQLDQPDGRPTRSVGSGFLRGGSTMFLGSIGLSLLISFVLMAVFKLPIFILAGFLPLLWWGRGSR